MTRFGLGFLNRDRVPVFSVLPGTVTMLILIAGLISGCSWGNNDSYPTVSLQDAQIVVPKVKASGVVKSSTRAKARQVSEVRRYTVEAGDTLYRIARETGASVEEIAIANGLDDPSTIRVGQELIIPAN
jgi:LysM repeat protein